MPFKIKDFKELSDFELISMYFKDRHNLSNDELYSAIYNLPAKQSVKILIENYIIEDVFDNKLEIYDEKSYEVVFEDSNIFIKDNKSFKESVLYVKDLEDEFIDYAVLLKDGNRPLGDSKNSNFVKLIIKKIKYKTKKIVFKTILTIKKVDYTYSDIDYKTKFKIYRELISVYSLSKNYIRKILKDLVRDFSLIEVNNLIKPGKDLIIKDSSFIEFSTIDWKNQFPDEPLIQVNVSRKVKVFNDSFVDHGYNTNCFVRQLKDKNDDLEVKNVIEATGSTIEDAELNLYNKVLLIKKCDHKFNSKKECKKCGVSKSKYLFIVD